jgi:hypothetical protein
MGEQASKEQGLMNARTALVADGQSSSSAKPLKGRSTPYLAMRAQCRA